MYWKDWLKLRPGVWQRYQSDLKQLIDLLKRDDEFQNCFSRATSGETGIQCFDEWANELTGHGTLYLALSRRIAEQGKSAIAPRGQLLA